MRGILFTLDGLIAMLVAFTFLVIVFSSFEQQPAVYDVRLDKAHQILFTADQAGVLVSGIETNADLTQHLDTMLQSSECGWLRIYNSTNSLVADANGTGCTGGAVEQSVAVRSFVNSSELYHAWLVIWNE